jgi:glycosyltransferase involved in cell wall biosynthesis
MPATPLEPPEPLVQVVGPTDGWVLERLARRLAAKLPYAAFVPWEPRWTGRPGLAYYVNYALYGGPSGLVDVGFFTHREDVAAFLGRARRLDWCVCMARQYADWLQGHGLRTVSHIPMGCDYYRYPCRLVLGVVGRLEHPRKGRDLVAQLRRLPFVELLATEGRLAEEELRAFYQRLDYVLIPATVEGGPLSLLEGLALGKPVIAPEGVGLVPEFGPTPHLRRYRAGDLAALVRLLTACYEEKRQRNRLVAGRTWDDWAEAHHQLFGRLLGERGLALPPPGPGFRFGLLRGLEIPAGVDAGGLEAALDRVAAHLYFGRPAQARRELQAVLPHYPCAGRLCDTLFRDET